MQITEAEKRILAGEEGEARQAAMQLLVDYGEALGADKLIEVTDATISVKGRKPSALLANREFSSMNELYSWANLASDKIIEEFPPVAVRRCSVLNSLLSKEYIDYLGITDPSYAESVDEVHEFMSKLGINDCPSCVPHLNGHLPSKGEHCISNESSQVIFLNSVLGARCNCESQVSSACAALVGRIPNSGMHLDENRMGTHLIKVEKIPSNMYEWDVLGYWIGKQIHIGVPVIDIDVPYIAMDSHKSMGASMCTSGQVDMYHVIGLTPEAGTYEQAFGSNSPKETFCYRAADEEATIKRLDWAEEENVDFVMTGCPNHSIFQIRDIAKLLEGKKCKTRLLINSARAIVEMARRNGDAQKIEAAGGFFLMDSCPPLLGLWPENIKVLATDSGKMAHYVPSSRPDFQIHFGSIEHCINAAVTGKW